MKSFQNTVNTPKNDGDQTKSLVDVKMTVITDHQTSRVIHPSEAAFDFPALTAASSGLDRATASGFFAPVPLKGWNSGLD
jgi:hypothetical protein